MSGHGTPLLVFDGDCGFCRFWVERWKHMTGAKVRYEPYQEVAARHPEIPLEHFERSVHLLEGKAATRGAEAVFRLLALAPGVAWPLALYRRLPLFAPVTEAAYAFVAARRVFFSWVTRRVWGADPTPPAFVVSSRLLVRGIALTYVIAFASLLPQIRGLWGAEGILPAQDLVDYVAGRFGSQRFWMMPTVFWAGASEGAMLAAAWAGIALGLVAAAGFIQAPALAGLWALYLSFVAVGRDFLSFQWDILLLEAGFLAVFLAPWKLRDRDGGPPWGAVWLMRWLLLRCVLSSGLVKLLSGDATWRDLSALRYHYWTQPLPGPLAWFVHQLPDWFQTASCVAMFAIELGVPLLLLLPAVPRRAGGVIILGFMGLIAATGNYCFFNLLTGLLCLSAFDDGFLRRIAPFKAAEAAPVPRAQRWALRFAAVPLLVLSGLELAARVLWTASPIPAPALAVLRVAAPFRTVNSYGLFAVMTTKRPEIVLEGSDDGVTWKEYRFAHKPGDPARLPTQVAPHQPRLDWQMWFAALGREEDSPWFRSFVARILQGSRPVLGLLAADPFPQGPPRLVRALLYEYRFSTTEERRKEGVWWKRELKGIYLPPASLRR